MLHWAFDALLVSVIIWLVCYCTGSLMILLVPGHSCGENVISKEFNGVSFWPLLRSILIAFVVAVLLTLLLVLF